MLFSDFSWYNQDDIIIDITGDGITDIRSDIFGRHNHRHPQTTERSHNHRQHGRHRHWQKSRKFVLELLTKEEPFLL